MEPQRNWAGNYTYSAIRTHRPATVEQVQAAVAASRKLRVLGSGHAFNGIADSTEDQISLAGLERVAAIDHGRRTVTVDGGMRYGWLAGQLHAAGYALANLASLPHISIAGAVATATHGSGVANRGLAAAVAALELVDADGAIVTLSREQHGEAFAGAVVGLGALGVVTRLTLDLVPAFALQQEVYDDLPLAELADHFDDIMSSAYSVSLFTDWRGDTINQIWLKRLVADGDTYPVAPAFFRATAAPVPRHPIGALSAENCTEQMGIPGPWHERLPHFRMNFTPSSGAELQSEYFVPRRHAVAALRAIAGLRAVIAPQLQIAEVRTIAADALWMSPCYQQECVAFHFTWAPNWPAVSQILPLIEERLAPFAARPHWGKLFTLDPARLRSLYPRLADFQDLLRAHDPRGKFRNAFVDTYVFGQPAG
jgi:alditol oxidase